MVKLRKSSIQTFIRCPYQYKVMYYEKKVPFKANIPMEVGSLFHKFAAKFFGLIDYKELEKTKLKDVKAYLQSLVPKDTHKLVLPLCLNFTEFEARHWVKLQKYTDKPLDYFIPLVTELSLKTKKIFPDVLCTGHIDRIDRMFEGNRAVVEYKTGRIEFVQTGKYEKSGVRDVRRELAYYTLLANAHGYNVNYIAAYNPRNNSKFVKPVGIAMLRVVKRRISQIVYSHKINSFPRRISSFCLGCPVFEVDCCNCKELQSVNKEVIK